MWLPLTSLTGQGRIWSVDCKTSLTQGPAALTNARAQILLNRPLRSSRTVRVHRPPSRSPLRQRVRVAMTAPLSAASRAFRTTSRASSAQQSEYSNPSVILRLERFARRVVGQPQRSGWRQETPAAQMIVKKKPDPKHPGGSEIRMMGQHKAKRPHDMGRDSPQNLALDERFANQTKLEMLQIAQAAMDQLARGARGRGGEIAFLAKIDRPAASGRVSGDSAAVDAAADDGDVESRAQAAPRTPQSLPKPKRAKRIRRFLRNARFSVAMDAITTVTNMASEKTNYQTNILARP